MAEHSHSERFYRLMRQVMPNWERVKEQLDQMAGRIFSG
ncbi:MULTISPECIES: YgjP-like metallopeptidase domain-containing protein [Idiomarina]|nr:MULTISPECIES: YgjP-like metallopeptidase domain-containing protein [Idiomarina]